MFFWFVFLEKGAFVSWLSKNKPSTESTCFLCLGPYCHHKKKSAESAENQGWSCTLSTVSEWGRCIYDLHKVPGCLNIGCSDAHHGPQWRTKGIHLCTWTTLRWILTPGNNISRMSKLSETITGPTVHMKKGRFSWTSLFRPVFNVSLVVLTTVIIAGTESLQFQKDEWCHVCLVSGVPRVTRWVVMSQREGQWYSRWAADGKWRAH